MAYFEQGSASDVNDLLGKVRVALEANGYVTVHNAGSGTSGGMRCHMSKGNLKVNLRTGFNNEIPVALAAERTSRHGNWLWPYSFWNGVWMSESINWLAMNLSTSHNMAASWHNQPGAPGSSAGKGVANMITSLSAMSRYWLFIHDSPDAVFLVVETAPNKVQHLAWGNLEMSQVTQNPCEWFFGSRRMYKAHEDGVGDFGYGLNTTGYANDWGMVRLQDTRWGVDDGLDGWGKGIIMPGTPNSYGSGNYWSNLGLPCYDSSNGSPSGVNGFPAVINQSYIEDQGRSILYPIHAYKEALGGGFQLLGNLPHVGRISMKPYVLGDQVAGVGESYLAFPSHCRVSPYSITAVADGPGNTSHQAEAYNHYGTGIAVRRP